MPVTHSFVSGVADGADATLVRPLDWNADHVLPYDTIGITVDGGGSVCTTGTKGYRVLDYGCDWIGWTVLCDQAGSIAIDVQRGPYTAGLSTSSVCGSQTPSVFGVQTSQDLTLGPTTTTQFTAGDVLMFYVDNVATVTRATLEMRVKKT